MMPDANAPVTADEREIGISKAVRKAFEAHSGVQELLSVGLNSEITLLWKDPTSDLDCKCRPDLLAIDGTIAAELKTTYHSVNPWVFRQKVVRSGYLHQAAFTRMACRELDIPLRDYFIVGLETREPYCVAVFRLKREDIDWAETELQSGLSRLSSCLTSGVWPGYEGIQDLLIPEEVREQYETSWDEQESD